MVYSVAAHEWIPHISSCCAPWVQFGNRSPTRVVQGRSTVLSKAYYCVGTHWDREWYETFQEFRMWLVETIDELIDLMAREPGFRCFHLDGQAIILEDYLEIRPERRETLLALLKEGRIVAGPWYDLPDEWLISGESFIRNLMKGMKVCRDLGFEPMNYGYTPDQFGHIAALPMILKGFDFKAGIVWRGTQDETYPAHFVWVGPDGSRLVTHKLMDRGSYGPFDFMVRRPIKQAGFKDESFKEHFESYWQAETARSQAPVVLMLDAIDHQPSDVEMPRLFAELEQRYPDIEFIWGSLEDYADELLKHGEGLPERRGELREPARDAFRVGQYLIVHTISSRYPVKRRNDECQALLERWVEPCALMQKLAGGAPIPRYIDLAWEYLLKNHPHDSICGCSIDQVHRDMTYRFDQCAEIADGVVRRAIAFTGHACESDAALAHVVMHNPLPYERVGVMDVSVAFPSDWPKRYIDGLATSERLNKFAIKDADGAPVPFQIRSIDRHVTYKRLKANGRRHTAGGDIYHLAVETTLPPCGFRGLRIEPTDLATRNFGTLRVAPMSAANEHFVFHLNPDGTAALWHPASDTGFEGLFQYEDSGDGGDGWTRGPLVADRVVVGPGSRVTTSLEEDHGLRTVFRVDREFDLPEGIDRSTGRRSDKNAVLRVLDRITVEKGSPCLRVRTTIDNPCGDHRFRVLFPTLIQTDKSFADTPFAIVERSTAIPLETARWHERVNPETAFTSFFGVQGAWGGEEGASAGLAVLSPFGLHEYEVQHGAEGAVLALTLFRATRQTVMTAGEPDGQLLGRLEFEYQLYPFAGDFRAAGALRMVAEAQTGVRVHTSGELPATTSFLHVEAEGCVVTALKPAADGDGAIVRVWNVGDEAVAATVKACVPIRSAELCNLNEERRDTLTPTPEGAVSAPVRARGLATIRFRWS